VAVLALVPAAEEAQFAPLASLGSLDPPPFAF